MKSTARRQRACFRPPRSTWNIPAAAGVHSSWWIRPAQASAGSSVEQGGELLGADLRRREARETHCTRQMRMSTP